MSDKKQPEKSAKPAKPKKVLTEEEKAEKARQAYARYLSWVMPLKGRHAFRGQANSEWALQSSAYRRLHGEMSKHPHSAGSMFVGYLHERVHHARMRFSEQHDRQPLEVMAQLQHYGAATGLIDFTESAQAALWFACKDEPKKDGKVFAVHLADAKKIEEINTRDGIVGGLEQFFPLEAPKKLWAWRPGDGSSRIVTQQSLFIFGRPDIGEEFFACAPFEVAAEEKDLLVEILKQTGISETFMFSDFAGFAAANAHGKKDYDFHLTKNYYDEKIGAIEKKDESKPIDEKTAKILLYFRRGNLNQALKRYQDAARDFTSVLEIVPQSAEAHFNRGNAYSALGRYEEALSDYVHAVKLNPQYAAAHTNRGITYGEMGRHSDALADHDRAIELDPQNAMAHNNRGNTYSALGRYADALADHTRAIELDPQDAGTHSNRGNTFRALGRYAEAFADHTRAIELDPQNAMVYNNRGNTYNEQGHYADALADYNRAIELDPQYADAHNNRGIAYSALNRHADALADHTRAIELNPQNARVHFNCGNAHHNLGHRAEAIADWKEAKRIGEQTGDTEAVQSATANLAKFDKPK